MHEPWGGALELGEINRAINLKIKPKSDLALYGTDDVWSSPLATLAIGAGDCEDYAIAKFVALQEAGVSADDLRIVILRDDIRKEYHAVVAARLDGNWLVLDNRHMVMVEDQQMRQYHPVFLSILTASSSTTTHQRDRVDLSVGKSNSALNQFGSIANEMKRKIGLICCISLRGPLCQRQVTAQAKRRLCPTKDLQSQT